MTDQQIFEQTRKVIYENMIKRLRDGKASFHYTKPSPERYPYQFFWDTCFHVYILVALGEQQMAREHLTSLFAMQHDDGFVGHMIYWDRLKPGRISDIFQSRPSLGNFFNSHMSSLIQPPLAAQAVEKVVEASDDQAFLEQMVPRLKKYYWWLASNRDFDGDGLLTIISPFESGMDWKPTYDPVVGFPQGKASKKLFMKMVWVDMRNFLYNFNLKKIYRKGYFLVKDVGMNTIYAQNLRALARLCRKVNDPEAERFSQLSEKVSHSILSVMYHDQDAAFYDVAGRQNEKIKIMTPTIFYPVVLQNMPQQISEKVMKRHFFNSQEFKTPFPLPSVSTSHSSFYPGPSMYIWRGPTWIVHNWFIHQYLMEKGYREESRHLIESVRQLIAKSGFREYYNPFSGEGYGATDFTWAGLVVDMIRMENQSADE